MKKKNCGKGYYLVSELDGELDLDLRMYALVMISTFSLGIVVGYLFHYLSTRDYRSMFCKSIALKYSTLEKSRVSSSIFRSSW